MTNILTNSLNENFKARTLIKKVIDYYEGNNEYDFTHIIDPQERDNEKFDAWVTLYNDLKLFMNK